MVQQAAATGASGDAKTQFKEHLQLLELLSAKTDEKQDLSPVYRQLTAVVRSSIAGVARTNGSPGESSFPELPKKLRRKHRDLLLSVLLSAENIPLQETPEPEITTLMNEIVDCIMEEGFIAAGYQNPRLLVQSVVEHLLLRFTCNDDSKIVQAEVARQTNVSDYYVDKILKCVSRCFREYSFLYQGKNFQYQWSHGFYLEEAAALAEGEAEGSGI